MHHETPTKQKKTSTHCVARNALFNSITLKSVPFLTGWLMFRRTWNWFWLIAIFGDEAASWVKQKQFTLYGKCPILLNFGQIFCEWSKGDYPLSLSGLSRSDKATATHIVLDFSKNILVYEESFMGRCIMDILFRCLSHRRAAMDQASQSFCWRTHKV